MWIIKNTYKWINIEIINLYLEQQYMHSKNIETYNHATNTHVHALKCWSGVGIEPTTIGLVVRVTTNWAIGFFILFFFTKNASREKIFWQCQRICEKVLRVDFESFFAKLRYRRRDVLCIVKYIDITWNNKPSMTSIKLPKEFFCSEDTTKHFLLLHTFCCLSSF